MLKAGVIILTVTLAYAAVYSLTAIIMPEMVLKNVIQASVGKTIENAQDDGYLKAFTVIMIHLGSLALAGVIADFYILYTGFRKAQKWAWLALFIAGGVGWLSGLILNIVIGNMMNIILQGMGTVMFLVGLLIPVKSFFRRQTDAMP